MPSDSRIQTALEALERPRDTFRSAVATADEEVRAYRLQKEVATDPVTALERELGLFARGRVDAGRLAGLMAVEDAPDPLTDGLMATAHDLFAAITAEGARAFHVEVPDGADLRDVIRDRMARLGRAFGVSHAVEKARSHRYDPDSDYVLLQPYPFHRWTGAERRLAPPVVASVRGEDLRAASLAELLDGATKLVLVVEGKVPPAPLARLISSGVFVAQTADEAVLARLSRHEGPGVVAWTEPGSGAVAFVHDPATGARTWERLEVEGGVEALAGRLAEMEARGRVVVGAGDLRHLMELATPPEGVAAAVAPAAAAGDGAGPTGPSADDPADRLAAWLLARTDTKGL